MLYKRVPAVFVLAVVLMVCGCKGSTSPSEDVGSTGHRTTSGPSITELEDETKLLDELIGIDACVFAFSGTFLQVWLEYEVKEGDSKESKVFLSPPVAITRHMGDQANGTTPVPEGKVVAWGVFGGGWDDDGTVRLRMMVEDSSGSRSTNLSFPISLPPLPKELGEGWRGGGGTSSKEFQWKCPAQLPGEGQVFTIASYYRSAIKTRSKPEFKHEVIRWTTYRIKGRCLPLVAPSPAPNEQAAVVALRKKGAWVKLEGFKGEHYEGASLGSAKEVTFSKRHEIEESQRVADADLVWLKQLAKLESLTLNGTEVTDDGLEHLKEMVQLKTIWLGYTKITGAGLVHLKGLTQLETLFLSSNTNITGVGLVHLKGLTKLRRLSLDETEITDAGLVHLKGLTKLKFLNLHGTKVTDAGVADLQKVLPNCMIYK